MCSRLLTDLSDLAATRPKTQAAPTVAAAFVPPIIWGMGKLMIFLLVSGLSCSALAQALPSDGGPQAQLVIAKLPPPSYPPMALAAHVFGDVELKVTLRREGTLDSVEAVSGPPMLRESAVGLAKQTQFECRHCDEASTPFRIVYRLELGNAIYCEERDKSYPRVTQSSDTVMIADRPFGTCDPAATIERVRVRSAKCLFLWRCGWR